MARSFTSGQYVVGSSATPINFEYNTPFSAGGWFYPSQGWAETLLIGHLNMGVGGAPGWELSYNNATGHLRIYLINYYPTYTLAKEGSYTFSAPDIGRWFHYIATYSGSTTAAGANLYFNGAINNGTTPIDTLGNNSIQSTIAPSVGIRSNSTVPLIGKIADCAVWNVELTAGEVAGLYRGMRPHMVRPNALALYWPLDGLSSPEPDLSGNRNNGTVSGATFGSGPPMSMFTPRWPRNYDPGPATVPLSQTHFRFRTDTEAVDATPTWGDAEDAA